MTTNLESMQIATSRFGMLDADEEQVVTIEGGLLGFPDATRFVRLPVDDTEGWVWLQSTTDPELAFLAISVFRFFPSYDVEIPDADAESIGLGDAADAEVLALVTVRHKDGGGIDAITANLLGPLVIDSLSGIGRQVVLSDSRYSTCEAVVG